MDIPSAKSLNRRNIPFYLAGALLLLGMKYYYSRGDPDSLSWILAPTARWVSALSGIPFIKVPQTGYVSHSCRFIIAASCSGLQFLMISMTALVFSYIHRMRTIKGKIGWMALSALASYLLTIFVNGFRILFSIFIPIHLGMSGTARTDIYGPAWAETAGASGPAPARTWSIWLTPKQLHTIIGTAVYFTALFAVCQLGEYVSRKCSAAPGTIPPGKQPGPGRILPHKDPGKMGCPLFLVFLHCFGDTIS